MSNDDTSTHDKKPHDELSAQPPQKRGFFEIPPPLKRVFDKFPLITYEDNELPVKARSSRSENVLYIFTSPEDASSGRPSFNPACLKWQVGVWIASAGLRSNSG